MWRDMAVWVSYGGINISGRINRSFYPRTRNGELKVISMIYAPPYLIRRRKPEVKSNDHELATSPMITREHTRRQTLESKQRCTTITTEQTRSRRQHNTTHYGIAPTVESGY